MSARAATCRMRKGAVGAGMYPALAKNPKLEVAGYPVSVVVNGQKAMPAFGGMFTDQQIADVVNYVRTHFGNNYKDKVTPADVKVGAAIKSHQLREERRHEQVREIRVSRGAGRRSFHFRRRSPPT